jgi:tetrahydromethanopterin S-methyltransferase subunit G
MTKRKTRANVETVEMAALNRVLEKLDGIDDKIEQMKSDNKRQAITVGAAAGGVSGGLVALTVMFIKAGM